jgi:hypothetical protein
MLKNSIATIELQKQMNWQAMQKLLHIPKSNSIEFDKYQVPVTVQSNQDMADMVTKLLEIETPKQDLVKSDKRF